MQKLGLIAGNGNFPIYFARAAGKKGIKITAVAIKGETSPKLRNFVRRIYWLRVGDFQKLFDILRKEELTKVVMAGKIVKTRLFEQGIKIDDKLKTLLKNVADKRDDSLLEAVAGALAREGVVLMDSTTFLEDLLPAPGIPSARKPSQEEWADINFARDIAKTIAGLDIGQTVVVKDKAVLAVEAIEGTDAAILRAGALGRGGVVVVKVAKPGQDMRFDIPVVGPDTFKSLLKAKAKVLCIESKKTLFIEKRKCIDMADRNDIAVVVL